MYPTSRVPRLLKVGQVTDREGDGLIGPVQTMLEQVAELREKSGK